MRAMILDTYGLTPTLRDAPDPTPGPNQLLVRVRAASVNPVDWKQASGAIKLLMSAKFPFVPGSDLAGEVVALGAGVTTFVVGDRVHTRLSGNGGGAYAELALAGIDVACHTPATLSDAEAAGLPLAGMTALQGVVTGVCSGRNVELVTSLGADAVIDYTKPEPYKGQAPFDVIYDCVGSAPNDFLPLLTANGRFASCMPGPSVFVGAALNLFRARKVLPVMLKPNAADLTTLDAWVTAGKLKVVIDSRFPLADVPKAWERSRSGRAVGKIVVEV
jgi:NADPH:quinone reductase-like Zn-dependent oxidoreductase